MRGIGGFGGGFLGLGMAGALAGALSLAAGDTFGSLDDRRRGTGWQDKPFRHPEGESSFRPTGSKRSRRRAAKRAK